MKNKTLNVNRTMFLLAVLTVTTIFLSCAGRGSGNYEQAKSESVQYLMSPLEEAEISEEPLMADKDVPVENFNT